MIRPVCVAFALAALAPPFASAHPVDEVVQAAYLTLATGEVRLELDIMPGPQVVAPMLDALDPNGDRQITAEEANAYAMAVLAQSSLTIDGRPADWTIDRVIAPDYRTLAVGDVLKIYAVAQRADRAGARTLAYENRYNPALSECVANVFLEAADGWRYVVTGQQHGADGRRLTVAYTAAR